MQCSAGQNAGCPGLLLEVEAAKDEVLCNIGFFLLQVHGTTEGSQQCDRPTLGNRPTISSRTPFLGLLTSVLVFGLQLQL